MLKKNLADYNSGYQSEANNLSSELYRDCLYSDSTIPATVRYQAVQLYHQKYLIVGIDMKKHGVQLSRASIACLTINIVFTKKSTEIHL